MRLIDADDLEKRIKDTTCYSFVCNGYDGRIGCSGCDTYNILKTIDDAPIVDPVKHGHWIVIKGSNGKDYDLCSVCAHTQEITGVKNYCAVCGAKMEPEIADFNEIETWNRTGG